MIYEKKRKMQERDLLSELRMQKALRECRNAFEM